MADQAVDSFARQFTVEAAERHAERLNSTHRVVVIHREYFFSYTTELHYNVVHCMKRNKFCIEDRE